MKKIVMTLVLLMAISVSAEAQKKEKKNKNQIDLAEYKDEIAKNEIMLRTMNFQINPTQVQAKTSKPYMITQYQYMRFYPNSIQIRTEKFDPAQRLAVHKDRSQDIGITTVEVIDGKNVGVMSPSEPEGRLAGLDQHIAPTLRNMMPFEVETASYKVEKNEPGPEEGTWLVMLTTQYEMTKLTLIITVRTTTGNCYVRVESNQEETWMYKGKIVPN